MRTSAKQALAPALIISSLLMLAAAYYSPIQESYHPLNSDWNGCSQVAGAASNLTFVNSYRTSALVGPALLAIIGPGVEFSDQDALQIQHFMETNGTVLLADDFGTGNGLLQMLNASVRFAEKPLADLAFYSKNPSFPIIADFFQSPLTANITALVFNHPTYLEITNSSLVTVLGVSSSFSFIDVNGTGNPSRNEAIQPYPVMASFRIGIGTLIVISDASIFTNEMINIYDNMRLLRNALRLGEGAMLFDEGHVYKAPFTDARIGLKNSVDSIADLMGRNPMGQFIPLVVVASVMMVAMYVMRRSTKNGKRVGWRIKLNSCILGQ